MINSYYNNIKKVINRFNHSETETQMFLFWIQDPDMQINKIVNRVIINM